MQVWLARRPGQNDENRPTGVCQIPIKCVRSTDMKQYPSITNVSSGRLIEFDAYVFDKLDGSNLRFEWDRKVGTHQVAEQLKYTRRVHPQGCRFW